MKFNVTRCSVRLQRAPELLSRRPRSGTGLSSRVQWPPAARGSDSYKGDVGDKRQTSTDQCTNIWLRFCAFVARGLCAAAWNRPGLELERGAGGRYWPAKTNIQQLRSPQTDLRHTWLAAFTKSQFQFAVHWQSSEPRLLAQCAQSCKIPDPISARPVWPCGHFFHLHESHVFFPGPCTGPVDRLASRPPCRVTGAWCATG